MLKCNFLKQLLREFNFRSFVFKTRPKFAATDVPWSIVVSKQHLKVFIIIHPLHLQSNDRPMVCFLVTHQITCSRIKHNWSWQKNNILCIFQNLGIIKVIPDSFFQMFKLYYSNNSNPIYWFLDWWFWTESTHILTIFLVKTFMKMSISGHQFQTTVDMCLFIYLLFSEAQRFDKASGS